MVWSRLSALLRSHPPTTSPPLFSKVRQICIVVDDFESTVSRFVDQLGVGPFKCWYFRPPTLHRTTFRGQPADWTMKLAITWLGDVQWEVIQPMEGSSLYREHLTSRGRGVQHILMDTGETPFDQAKEILETKGHPFAQTAAVNPPLKIGSVTLPPLPSPVATPVNLQFGYLDTEPTLRTSVELTRYPLWFTERQALRWGKAEFSIPERDFDFERSLPNRRLQRLVKASIVTRDLDATMRSWLDIAGVRPWRVFERDEARIGWALVDDILFEVIEPRAPGPYQDILEQRGEGVASLGVEPAEDLDGFVTRCAGHGYACLADTSASGAYPAALIGSRKGLGTDLEAVATDQSMPALFFRSRPDRVLHSR